MSFATPPSPFDLAKGKKDFKTIGKLKYYCQLCKKQCPDKNGFDCHIASNTHLMNMRLFSENPEKYIEEYSQDFEEGYLEVLRKKYQGQKILANKVYQDYISDKMHTHMNATKWTNLTSFVDYLTKGGKIESEWTDKGLFIQTVDTRAEILAKKKEEERKIQEKLKKEEKEKKAMDEQLELARQFHLASTDKEESKANQPAPVDLEKERQQISFSFGSNTSKKTLTNPLKKAAATLKTQLQPNIVISIHPSSALNDSVNILDLPDDNGIQSLNGKRKPVSGIEKVLESAKASKKVKPDPFGAQTKEQTKTGEEESEDFSWIVEGIIVKIKDESLPKYHNQKAKIIRVVEPFLAELEVISNKAKIQVDQDLLETVIPQVGNKVKILKQGSLHGKVATLESVHQDSFSVSVFIEEADLALELPFEKISKCSA